MTMHMIRELDRLKKMLLALSAVVEERVQDSVKALLGGDAELAAEVIAGDTQVDELEVDLEEECLKILALHQPVAADLRFIVSVLKINNDLERMSDYATNIAERASELAGPNWVEPPFDVAAMTATAEKMVDMSLVALVNLDRRLAVECITLDDELDRMHKGNFDQVKAVLRSRPEQMDSNILYLSISRYLERIGDLATNIAEDVIYLIDGEIVRHIEDWSDAT